MFSILRLGLVSNSYGLLCIDRLIVCCVKVSQILTLSILETTTKARENRYFTLPPLDITSH